MILIILFFSFSFLSVLSDLPGQGPGAGHHPGGLGEGSPQLLHLGPTQGPAGQGGEEEEGGVECHGALTTTALGVWCLYTCDTVFGLLIAFLCF